MLVLVVCVKLGVVVRGVDVWLHIPCKRTIVHVSAYLAGGGELVGQIYYYIW